MASGVVLMHRDDLKRVAPLWLHYSEVSESEGGEGAEERHVLWSALPCLGPCPAAPRAAELRCAERLLHTLL